MNKRNKCNKNINENNLKKVKSVVIKLVLSQYILL